MEPFEFYDELERLALSNSSMDQLSKLFHLIIQMTEEQLEILGAIIIHYSIKTGHNLTAANIDKLYSSKKMAGRGRMFSVKALPELLQKIIVAYLKWLQK